jgi:hypothetical protein
VNQRGIKNVRRLLKYLFIVAGIVGLLVLALHLIAWCSMTYRSKTIFRQITDTKRIVIAPGKMMSDISDHNAVLLDTTDRDTISGLLTSIDLSSDIRSFGHCFCDGEFRFTLTNAAGEKMVMTLHHGQMIRFGDGIDNYLTAGSAFKITEWMADYGVFEKLKKIQKPGSAP